MNARDFRPLDLSDVIGFSTYEGWDWESPPMWVSDEDPGDLPYDDEDGGTYVWCPAFIHQMPLKLKNAGEPCRECESDA